MIDGKLLGPAQPDQLDEHDQWEQVVTTLPHLGIMAFEAKALYTFPLMRQLAEAAILLVRSNMDLPGYVDSRTGSRRWAGAFVAANWRTRVRATASRTG